MAAFSLCPLAFGSSWPSVARCYSLSEHFSPGGLPYCVAGDEIRVPRKQPSIAQSSISCLLSSALLCTWHQTYTIKTSPTVYEVTLLYLTELQCLTSYRNGPIHAFECSPLVCGPCWCKHRQDCRRHFHTWTGEFCCKAAPLGQSSHSRAGRHGYQRDITYINIKNKCQAYMRSICSYNWWLPTTPSSGGSTELWLIIIKEQRLDEVAGQLSGTWPWLQDGQQQIVTTARPFVLLIFHLSLWLSPDSCLILLITLSFSSHTVRTPTGLSLQPHCLWCQSHMYTVAAPTISVSCVDIFCFIFLSRVPTTRYTCSLHHCVRVKCMV